MGSALGSSIGSAFGLVGQEQNWLHSVDVGQRNIAEYNRASALANLNATDALVQGGQDAGFARMKAGNVLNEQNVAYADSGVTNQGTPGQVAAGTAMLAELDAKTAENNALRRAFGYQEAGRRYGLAAEQTRSDIEQGFSALATGAAGTGTSILGTAVGAGLSFGMGGG